MCTDETKKPLSAICASCKTLLILVMGLSIYVTLFQGCEQEKESEKVRLLSEKEYGKP